MRDLLQTVIPVMVTAIVASRVAVTRTGRLRKDIHKNIDLLGKLPADHPNRAMLEANNGELLGLLVRRQQRRYGPFTQAGVSFGAYAGVAAVALAFGCFGVLLAARVIPSASDPPDPETGGLGRGSSWSWRSASPWPRSEPPADNSESIAGGTAADRGRLEPRLWDRPGRPGEAPDGLLTAAQRRWHGLTPGADQAFPV